MSVTDQYICNDVVYRVLENGANAANFPTLLTNMFTPQEILDSLNRVQQEFLLETGAIVTRTTIAGSVGTPRYDLPTDSIRPRRLTWTELDPSTQLAPIYLLDAANATWRVSVTNAGLLQTTLVAPGQVIANLFLNDTTIVQVWQVAVDTNGQLQTIASAGPAVSSFSVNSPAGAIWQVSIANGLFQTTFASTQGIVKTKVLTQTDTWELDNGASNWSSDRAIPITWVENQLPQQTVQVAKTPDNNGIIGLLYVALATTLDGTGVLLTVPDDWTPYIVWGTIGELLASDGDAFDPVRAQYCNRRFEEGIELARIVLGGMD